MGNEGPDLALMAAIEGDWKGSPRQWEKRGKRGITGFFREAGDPLGNSLLLKLERVGNKTRDG